MDTSKYIGIPFKPHGRDRDGLDCWGLLRLIYYEELGIDLPSYIANYSSTEDQHELSRLIREEMGPWFEIPMTKELPLDAVLLRLKGEPMHLGIVARGGFMIHVMKGINTCLERYWSPVWAKRIVGFFRHELQMTNDQ